MSIQTTIELKGVLGGKEQTCFLIQEARPEEIFKGRTLRELFLLNVPNPNCYDIREEEIQISISFQRECYFGATGLTTASIEVAIEEAAKIMAKTEKELFDEGVPDPNALLAAAVKALLEGSEKEVFALANTFDYFAKATLGPEGGEDGGKKFLQVATILAEDLKKTKAK